VIAARVRRYEVRDLGTGRDLGAHILTEIPWVILMADPTLASRFEVRMAQVASDLEETIATDEHTRAIAADETHDPHTRCPLHGLDYSSECADCRWAKRNAEIEARYSARIDELCGLAARVARHAVGERTDHVAIRRLLDVPEVQAALGPALEDVRRAEAYAGNPNTRPDDADLANHITDDLPL
jgi:hypothetical protein